MTRKEEYLRNKKINNEYLTGKLKILGFNEEDDTLRPMRDSVGYRALRRIGRDLGNFAGANEQEIEDDKLFMENQDEFFSRVRSIYEDCGLHMKGKVSREDWALYAGIVRKTGTMYKALIRENRKRDYSKVARTEKLIIHDKISELVDSAEFAKACAIEDKFMLEELESFKTLAELTEYDSEKVRNTSCAVSMAMLVRESEEAMDEKRKYMTSYEKYEKFVNGLKRKITIRGATEKVEDERD